MVATGDVSAGNFYEFIGDLGNLGDSIKSVFKNNDILMDPVINSKNSLNRNIVETDNLSNLTNNKNKTSSNQPPSNQGTSSNQPPSNQGTSSNQPPSNQGTSSNQPPSNQGTSSNNHFRNKNSANSYRRNVLVNKGTNKLRSELIYDDFTLPKIEYHLSTNTQGSTPVTKIFFIFESSKIDAITSFFPQIILKSGRIPINGTILKPSRFHLKIN